MENRVRVDDRVYSLRVELTADQCRRLRRLVKSLQRDASEVMGLGLDLFWCARAQGRAVENGRGTDGSRRCDSGRSAVGDATSKRDAVRNGAVRRVQSRGSVQGLAASVQATLASVKCDPRKLANPMD